MADPQLSLTKKQIIFLYFYYVLLILISLVFLLVIIFTEKLDVISMGIILIASLCSGAIGSSSCYVRKLYRNGMNDRFLVSESLNCYCIHTFIYYFFRPIFAATSSLFVVIGIKQGFFLLSPAPGMNSGNFFYLCIFISFLIGFNVARLFGFFNKENIIV